MTATVFKALEILQDFIDANVREWKTEDKTSEHYKRLREAIDSKVCLIDQMFDVYVEIDETLHIHSVRFGE